jgi:ComF family protein
LLSQLLSQFRNPFRNGFDLFLAQPCPTCDRPPQSHKIFCLACDRQLQTCRLTQPAAEWQGEVPVFAWGAYRGGLKRSLAALKYNNQPKIATQLGQWLAQAWLESPVSQLPPPLVVPIPLHAHKLKQRGFNQAELIAIAFCHTTGLPLRQQGLLRVRDTEAQFGLGTQAREKNVAGAFELGKDLRRVDGQQSVLLVDDIYTTGATVREAIALLHRQQIRRCGVVAVARSGMGEDDCRRLS